MNGSPGSRTQPHVLHELMASARRVLAAAAVTRALLRAVVVAAMAMLLLVLVDALVGPGAGARRTLLMLAALAFVVPVVRDVRRLVLPALRASVEDIALWFERRVPSLRYALVTAVGQERPDPALLGAIAATPLARETGAAARAALARPLLMAAIAVVAVIAVPSGAIGRVTRPAAGDGLDRPGAAAGAAADPLATIVVRVRPPAYSGEPARDLDDPSAVHALVGSRVVVEGLGSGVEAEGLAAVRAQDGDRWRVTLTVPGAAAALRLRAPQATGGARERVLLVEPVADSLPEVRLEEPARDSVMRVARGNVALRAALRDDHGLADGWFEYIVSSGAGETFTFRGGRVAARRFDGGPRGAARAALQGVLLLDSLRLAPGDLVHLRAVARDRNDVTGPGVGASETRTLRVARADEYDSVSVDPMPPTEPEKNALSQRMILELTRDLRRREPRIGAAATTREARVLAVEQTKLRKRVGEVVFVRLGENEGEHAHFAGDGHEHGAERPLDPDAILAAAERAANQDPTRMLEGEGEETPVVAINRPLLEAYNHMWQASTELETGDPGAAIPWMERAIEALQRARAAERIYLRGRPSRVVVDLARVRGTGRDRGAPDARTPRTAADPERAARLRRFDALLARAADAPDEAADALLLLRLTLPADEAATATALTDASDALRQGGDATAALQRARRALVGAPARRADIGPWGW